jgi:hypothetical protein
MVDISGPKILRAMKSVSVLSADQAALCTCKRVQTRRSCQSATSRSRTNNSIDRHVIDAERRHCCIISSAVKSERHGLTSERRQVSRHLEVVTWIVIRL